MTYFKTFLAAF